MRLRIARWIERHLGDDWGGNPDPPGVLAKLNFGDLNEDGEPVYFARTHCNAGSELWIGGKGVGWLFHCRAEHARQLAWFILWDWWAKETWFGLRRWVWYKALGIIMYNTVFPNGALTAEDTE